MIRQFNVLDRSLPLHQNYLLEASAGTGKTFSIQNLVVRLLIEENGGEEPLPIQKILVVTFTRATARDLKSRIRANIEGALSHLEAASDQKDCPDYLKEYLERGGQAIILAKKRLQQALFMFDQAQIFTIHSFCARMLKQFSLESDMGLHVSSTDEPIPKAELIAIIRDYFRTEVCKENDCPAQLEIYLKGDPDQKRLMTLIQSGHDFFSIPSFENIFMQFKEGMSALKSQYGCLESEKLIEDFRKQAANFRNYSSETKEKTLEKIIRFSKLFDQKQWSAADLDKLILDGFVWTKALNPSLFKEKSKFPVDLNYPYITRHFADVLHLLIEEAGDFSRILLRMANDCRKYLKRFQKEEEKLSPDDFLRKMHEALDQPSFFQKVQGSYQAAIVDEFQDTDPLQWQIFSRLFLSENKLWKGNIYLVGDPKQSIYSFRQADIYTYLKASDAIGKNNCLSLNVNYRSTAPLVEALNVLFAEEHLPQFIPLPKKESYLSCNRVQAAQEEQIVSYDEQRGAVHFFIADSSVLEKPSLLKLEINVFFPFMINEIKRLKLEMELSYKQCAVLVRDRKQALRVAEAFESRGIPCHSQRGTSLADSPALQGLTDLIRALMHPHDLGVIRAALASPLMGWTVDELKNSESTEYCLLLIRKLSISLTEKGFALFYQEFLNMQCKPDQKTLLEELLGRLGGLEIYRDLQLIADIVIDHQFIEWNGSEGLVPFLDQFHLWEEHEDERVKRFQDPSADGVRILTLHVSKGLEFEVVFALGLINRSGIRDELIPLEKGNKTVLTPVKEDEETYKSHCEESDSEKMRQLYVALTRAKSRLYIPAALHFPAVNLKWGEASPIELFLARLHRPAATYQELYERIGKERGVNLVEFIEDIGGQHHISYSLHQEVKCSAVEKDYSIDELSLNPPPAVIVPGTPLWMTSFTSLSRHLEREAIERLPNLLKAPKDFKCIEKTMHSLPANSNTGLLIHAILEKINFNEFRKLENAEQACDLIRPYIRYTPFKEWELSIAALLFHALKTPMIAEKICLADLADDQFYREMPFVFPYKKGDGIEELTFKEGLIKGVIDMFFYHEGFYYLVDWKTNWLGPQTLSYDRLSLEKSMLENAYFLQAEIYVEAIRRYLKLVDERPFEECFGGVYYLFLRGMDLGQTTGIYHFLPKQLESNRAVNFREEF